MEKALYESAPLMVNDAGAVEDIETDVSGVIADEARISSIIYEGL